MSDSPFTKEQRELLADVLDTFAHRAGLSPGYRMDTARKIIEDVEHQQHADEAVRSEGQALRIRDERIAAMVAVCDGIREIMATYRKQEARGGVDTPGGLEHMGDVWRLLSKWDAALTPKEPHHD